MQTGNGMLHLRNHTLRPDCGPHTREMGDYEIRKPGSFAKRIPNPQTAQHMHMLA